MTNQIKIQLHQVAASTSEAVIRDHRVLIDRPAAKGGADSGPMGGELFLASVGGCFMSNLLAAIKARAAEVSDIRTEVSGTLADSPARFTTEFHQAEAPLPMKMEAQLFSSRMIWPKK